MPALDTSASPYYRMHKDNPVQWRLWGPEALAEAQSTGKPLFVSIGYVGCLWCHVLNEESFSDDATAALINENFIPVLLDRDERPDVDIIFQAAAPPMGAPDGWPLNMFLTPEGAPFFVVSYLPAEERLGMPSFRSAVNDAAKLWTEHNMRAREQAAQVRQQLDVIFGRDMRAPPERIRLDEASLRVAQTYDIFFGGQLGQQKFLQPTNLELLWRAFLRNGYPQYSQVLFASLDHILFGGIYDHIGGGLFRYARDERWLVPQFEKRLIDNVQMIDVMTGVWQHNRSGLCLTRTEETVGWILREMKLPGGGFAAALDGVTDREDGRFYVWSEAELEEALAGTFAAKFKAVYEVKPEGNFAGRNILRRMGSGATTTPADEMLMARQRGMLLEARDKRTRPLRDEKLLTDWNGLAIAALANAGAVFDKPDWIAEAVSAFDAVVAALDENGTLHHSAFEGRKGAPGFASDYAYMARAALVLYEVLGEKRFLEAARRWTDTLNRHFWDAEQAGYFYTSDQAETQPMRVRVIHDVFGPAPNGVMLWVLARLVLLTGDRDLSRRGIELLTAFADETNTAYLSMATYLNGAETYAAALQVTIFGERSNPRTQELIRAVWGKALPNRLLVVIEPGMSLPEGHPAAHLSMQAGQPTAYICQGTNCSAPILNAATLAQALTTQPAPPPARAN